MNVPHILKTLRMRDKQIADAMGVKVAQISRRQKEIQQPSDENKVKLREFIENHIFTLQQYLDGETPMPTKEPELQQQAIESNETEPTSDTDAQENDEEAEAEPEPEIKPTRKPRYNEGVKTLKQLDWQNKRNKKLKKK